MGSGVSPFPEPCRHSQRCVPPSRLRIRQSRCGDKCPPQKPILRNLDPCIGIKRSFCQQNGLLISLCIHTLAESSGAGPLLISRKVSTESKRSSTHCKTSPFISTIRAERQFTFVKTYLSAAAKISMSIEPRILEVIPRVVPQPTPATPATWAGL